MLGSCGDCPTPDLSPSTEPFPAPFPHPSPSRHGARGDLRAAAVAAAAMFPGFPLCSRLLVRNYSTLLDSSGSLKPATSLDAQQKALQWAAVVFHPGMERIQMVDFGRKWSQMQMHEIIADLIDTQIPAPLSPTSDIPTFLYLPAAFAQSTMEYSA